MCLTAGVPLIESGTAGFAGLSRGTDRGLPGSDDVLRLQAATGAQDVPGLHDPRDAEYANPLHRLGQVLSLRVRSPTAAMVSIDIS
jgi:hypothetical protein